MSAPREGASKSNDEFPSELQDRLGMFDKSLNDVEDILKPLFQIPINELHEKTTALEKAKIDLVGLYAMNSLFWMYLNVKGINPKDHDVKRELDRIKANMTRIKDIQDKQNAPRLDKPASKRFLRNALWQAAQAKGKQDKTETATKRKSEESGPLTSKNQDETTPSQKKKKKKKKNK